MTAGPEQNAAYGEPPITVACGVPQPAMCRGGAPSVRWTRAAYAACLDERAQARLHHDGPEVAVRVTVPSRARTGAWANEFSARS